MVIIHSFHNRPQRRTHSRFARGLTMFETALATVVVGTAVLAIVQLITAVTQENFYAQKTTTALTLCNTMRELIDGLPFNDPATGTHLGPNNGAITASQFNDVEDFAGYSASPPIDVHCQPLTALPNWKQTVTVTHVLPGNYTASDPVATDSGCVLDRIQVTVSYLPPGTVTWVPISSINWLKAKI